MDLPPSDLYEHPSDDHHQDYNNIGMTQNGADPRARKTYNSLEETGNDDMVNDADLQDDDDDDDDEDFYTPGPDSLYDTRVEIADYSLQQAQKRLQNQYDRVQKFDAIENLKSRRRLYSHLDSNFTLHGVQPLSNRFISSLSFNENSNLLAAASWDGSCYLVDPTDLSIAGTIPNLHPEKISGLDWSSSLNLLATGGSDGILNLVSDPDASQDSPSRKVVPLSGHLSRINDVKFHPINSLIATASADLTWRLWDINKQQELYYQEGHVESVNALSIHPDGSILASAASDSVLKLWDLRSGNSILNLLDDGHIKPIHALDWRVNGYHLASGGADSQLIIWDIRMGRKVSSVLAHNKLVSSVKFSDDGHLLVSTGYDGTLSLTASDSWVVLKKFNTLDKIMDCQLVENGTSFKILTGGWDRGIKLYTTDV